MASISDRPLVRRTARTVLASAFAATAGDELDLSATTVHYAQKGDQGGDWCVQLALLEPGDEEVDGMAQGSTPRTDVYTLSILVEVFGADDEEAGDAQVMRLVEVVDEALFTGDRLGAVGVTRLYPSRWSGPHPSYGEASPPTYVVSWARREVEIHTSIRP